MINKYVFSCQVATELMEKKHRTPLTAKEQMQLLLHQAKCSACKYYEKHSLFLEKLFKAKEKGNADIAAHKKTVELEERILKRLNE